MKSTFIKILIVLFLIAPFLIAQEVHYANQVTVAWDPVSDTGTITYEVFITPYPIVDPQNPGAHNLVGETAATDYTITFQTEGKYAVGIRTKKSIDGEIFYSDINWSDENGVYTPNPFILGYYIPPDVVTNFRME